MLTYADVCLGVLQNVPGRAHRIFVSGELDKSDGGGGATGRDPQPPCRRVQNVSDGVQNLTLLDRRNSRQDVRSIHCKRISSSSGVVDDEEGGAERDRSRWTARVRLSA